MTEFEMIIRRKYIRIDCRVFPHRLSEIRLLIALLWAGANGKNGAEIAGDKTQKNI